MKKIPIMRLIRVNNGEVGFVDEHRAWTDKAYEFYGKTKPDIYTCSDETPRVDKSEEPVSSTRMMTLDPSANIITYSHLADMRHADKERALFKLSDEIVKEKLKSIGMQDNKDAVAFLEFQLGNGYIDWDVAQKARENLSDEQYNAIQSLMVETKEASSEAHRKWMEENYDKFYSMDLGVYATLKGYDAINASGHGVTDSYMVVLNRTKLIMSDEHIDPYTYKE